MSKLFEPTEIKNLHLKNRLFRSATWEAACDDFGHISQELYDLYDALAKGGIGCIITSATIVSGTDQELPKALRMHDDGIIPDHKKLVDIIHQSGTPVLVQLGLGNFGKTIGDKTITSVLSDDLDENDIEKVESLFEQAAVRAKAAGYDGVQIHSAHGYFLSRSISPLYNHRTDRYGGTVEKRATILREVVRRIRRVIPDLHLSIKINSDDEQPGGLTEDECLEICKLIVADGIDSIELSGGNPIHPAVRAGVNDSYYRHAATRIGKEVSVPVIEVGGNRRVSTMEEILSEGGVSYFSLSRPVLREPNLPARWAAGDLEDSKCVSCRTCLRILHGRCILVEQEEKKKAEQEGH